MSIFSTPYPARERTLLLNLTIPVFELVIVEWIKLQKAAEAAEVTGAVSDATNTVLEVYARTSKEQVATTAGAIQRPALNPETLMAVAQSLAEQAQALTKAYEQGIEARHESDLAIMKGQALMAAASDRQSDRILELVTGATRQQFTTPDTPALPAFMAENAASVLARGELNTP